jgi:hypothetical protein
MDLKLKNIRLRALQSVKVKALAQAKTAKGLPPEQILAMAEPEIEKDVEHFFSRIREYWGFRRKEITIFDDEPLSRTIRTPLFDYQVRMELDPEDSAFVIWCREVNALKSSEIALSQPFAAVFGDLFGTVVFEFEKPVPIADLIDQIEENPRQDLKLFYDPRCTWCEIRVSGFSGTLKFEANSMTVESPGTGLTTMVSKLLNDLHDYCDIDVTAPALAAY